jgi:hypothetical protein
MVKLSSFYVYIYRGLMMLIIILCILNLLILNLILKIEIEAFDLTFNIVMIIICSIILYIFLKFYNVYFNKKDKKLYIKTWKKEFTIQNIQVYKVERFFLFACRIKYRNDEGTKKNVIFLPRLREFFPLFDYPKRIKILLFGCHSRQCSRSVGGKK